MLTVVALVGLGTSTVLVRFIFDQAYAVGDEVADANSRLRTISLTGVQGVPNVRPSDLRSESVQRMRGLLDQHY